MPLHKSQHSSLCFPSKRPGTRWGEGRGTQKARYKPCTCLSKQVCHHFPVPGSRVEKKGSGRLPLLSPVSRDLVPIHRLLQVERSRKQARDSPQSSHGIRRGAKESSPELRIRVPDTLPASPSPRRSSEAARWKRFKNMHQPQYLCFAL